MATLRELANELDASDMLGHIRNFPADLANAWDASESWDLSAIENTTFRCIPAIICKKKALGLLYRHYKS